MTPKPNLKRQVFYFGLIGFLATLTQLCFVFLFVDYGKLHPLMANVLAFFVAFQVSFFGHRNLTFAQMPDQKLRFVHFFTVAASAGLLNETLYFLLLHFTTLHYLPALLLVIGMVSLYNFILSRYWACR